MWIVKLQRMPLTPVWRFSLPAALVVFVLTWFIYSWLVINLLALFTRLLIFFVRKPLVPLLVQSIVTRLCMGTRRIFFRGGTNHWHWKILLFSMRQELVFNFILSVFHADTWGASESFNMVTGTAYGVITSNFWNGAGCVPIYAGILKIRTDAAAAWATVYV